MELLNKTGVPIKNPGDGLSAKEINALNLTINSTVDVANAYLKDYCNANSELAAPTRQLTLMEAVRAVPSGRRTLGQTVKFLSTTGSWIEYSFIGISSTDDEWFDESNWTTGKMIDGGEW